MPYWYWFVLICWSFNWEAATVEDDVKCVFVFIMLIVVVRVEGVECIWWGYDNNDDDDEDEDDDDDDDAVVAALDEEVDNDGDDENDMTLIILCFLSWPINFWFLSFLF